MKKRSSFLAFLLIFMLILAACGGDDKDDKKDSPTATVAVQNTEAVATATDEVEATVEATTEPTEEATIEASPEVTEEATAATTEEATSEATEEAEGIDAEATIEATEESTPEATEEVTTEATEETTPEATEEATAEATEETTPEATEEATAEATEETTPEATVEAVITPAPEATSTSSADLKTLTIGTTDQVSQLDPADAYSFHDWEILRNVSDGLLAYVPGTTDIEPRLAVDLPTVSEDGLTYTFKLRSGVKFPDGTELSAQIVVDWINRSLTLQGSPFGLISMIQSVAVGAEDEVVFTLSAPFDLFPLTVASQPQLMPFAADNYPVDAINNQPATIQGVGPYQVVDYVIGERTILEVNPNYYGPKPAYDRVIFVYFQDAVQLTLAVENGDIDMAWRSVTATDVNRLAQISNLSVLTIPGRIHYLLFNHESEIGGNANVRTAIAKLIDRDEIIDRALSGLADPIYSMVPPGFTGATESYLEQYGFRDVEGAKSDLEAAGYTADSKLVLDLWYPPERYGTEMIDVVTILEQQIEESGLVEVNLQSVEWTTYVEAATSGDYPFYVLGWFFDYPDADNYLHPFASCEGSAGLGINYCSEAMESLFTAERSSVGTPEREDALKELQDFYAAEVVSIPLWVSPTHMVYDNTSVTGVILGPPTILEYRLLQPVE